MIVNHALLCLLIAYRCLISDWFCKLLPKHGKGHVQTSGRDRIVGLVTIINIKKIST